ncbi:MAG: hypothetical protein GF311_16685 [Candidatus Lokiarchaeota archaeon]|nr:hypothetical protein [Candidatus Lokiarchaeota archaeon]
MTMVLEKSIICKLGGNVNSNPELLISYPPLEVSDAESKDLVYNCLPTGCKSGDIVIKKYENYSLISYIFSLKKEIERDDLFSFSILLNKKINPELYTSIMKHFIEILENNSLLTEEILINYQNVIYESFNEEKDLKIEGKSIKLSNLFENLKKEFKKDKPDLKGHFF